MNRSEKTFIMPHIRKPVMLVAAAAVAMSVLGGCGLMHRDAEPTPIPPVEMALISFDAAGSWNEAEEALTDQFRELQPNVSFSHSTYVQPPAVYFSQPHVPDLMVISPGYALAGAIGEQRLVELTDLWEQSGLLEHYPAGFRDLSAIDGKQYYLPVAYTWTGIYYNKEVFAEFGLDPPATWDEFIAVCDTLLANGVTPLSVAGDDVFLSTLWLDYLSLRLNGLEFHRQLTNGEVSYEDDRVRTVLELWGWMIDRGYFVEHPERMNATDSVMSIVTTPAGLTYGDRAAMTLTSPTWMGSIPQALRSGLDFFAFPTIDPNIPVAETLTAYGYMIPQDAPNMGAALSFVEYAGSADAQANMVPRLNTSAAGLAPANTSAGTAHLPDRVRRGSAIVTGAAGVAPFFVLAVPDSMWEPVGRALAYFLQNPWDTETVTTMLESARQEALAAGDFQHSD